MTEMLRNTESLPNSLPTAFVSPYGQTWKFAIRTQ